MGGGQDRQCNATLLHSSSSPLGIKSLDLLFIRLLLSKSRDIPAHQIDHIMASSNSMAKLQELVEKSRKVLSANLECQVNCENLLQDIDLYFLVTRKEYTDCLAPVLASLTEFLFSQLTLLKVQEVVINRVELLGGGARIPVLHSVITNLLQSD